MAASGGDYGNCSSVVQRLESVLICGRLIGKKVSLSMNGCVVGVCLSLIFFSTVVTFFSGDIYLWKNCSNRVSELHLQKICKRFLANVNVFEFT